MPKEPAKLLAREEEARKKVIDGMEIDIKEGEISVPARMIDSIKSYVAGASMRRAAKDHGVSYETLREYIRKYRTDLEIARVKLRDMVTDGAVEILQETYRQTMEALGEGGLAPNEVADIYLKTLKSVSTLK